ncbi:type III secretion apparatus needle protein [Breoghania corrubedonensis]|uniref:Type III secretion apparatus needle protein n=1 Tax=Breoghania corrubedonensis TaxID=665038 RepID=A0A2T5UYV4_9HYPH|nr:EscF/YscF/HrpA family type III secretion system needle major subunit [Breoghania corrubedonensis]PTW56660.1 type III secretion apparatus needle protein [Breoghania corrubedonensis]
MANISSSAAFTGTSGSPPTYPGGTGSANYNANREGFDLIFRQTELQGQMAAIEEDIRNIEANTNLSDTEKMFSMQMAMNAWSAVTNLRTNMIKSVSDSLKTIARNVN